MNPKIWKKRQLMNKYAVILVLLVLNGYANKNWIKLDPTDNKNQNDTDLKMYTSKSSLLGIKESTPSNTLKTTNNSDDDFINIIKKIYDAKQKIESKIKSNNK